MVGIQCQGLVAIWVCLMLSSFSYAYPPPPFSHVQDFLTGEALQLECLCKGEVAMRHQQCAIEWSKVGGGFTSNV